MGFEFCRKLTKFSSPFSLMVDLLEGNRCHSGFEDNCSSLLFVLFCFPGSLTKIHLLSKLGIFNYELLKWLMGHFEDF